MNYDIDSMWRYDTKEKVSAIDYCKKIIDNTELPFEVYIGTDSQFVAGKIKYTTVVAFRFGNKGVRGIYRSLIQQHNSYELYERKKKRRKSGSDRRKTLHSEIYERLRKETELSLEVANHLKDVLKIKQIDLDYSSKAINLSNKVVMECQALCSYYGYKYSLKDQEQVATPFADKICK